MTSARKPRQIAPRMAAAAIVALSLFAGRAARADEPVRPEVDQNPSSYPPPAARPNLMLVGAAVTIGWYGAALGTSYLWKQADSAPSLRIPVAGPYLALTKTRCAAAEPHCSTFSLILRTALTSLSLVGQTGGLVAILEGALVPTSVSSEDRARAEKRRGTHVAVLPTPMNEGGGIAVFGEF